MKYISLFLVVMFLLFAGWQLNDPDPVLWVTIYLVAAYVSFRAYQGKFNQELLLVLAVSAATAATNSFLQITAWEGMGLEDLSMKTMNQELAREAFGLVICLGSYFFTLFRSGMS